MKKWTLLKWLLSFITKEKSKVFAAITLGILSNLSVVTIPLIGLRGVLLHLNGQQSQPLYSLGAMVFCGILRGVTRYGEQYLNHDIAFRLLAMIREQIFATVRLLGPAKLSEKKSGDLVTAITSDVEALEVFFAHTISPVLIAAGTTCVTVGALWYMSPLLGILLLCGHLLVGLLIPVIGYRKSRALGDAYQSSFVALNQAVMETINSLQDIAQYSLEKEQVANLDTTGKQLNQQYQQRLAQESLLRLLSEGVLLLTAVCIFIAGVLFQSPSNTVLLGVVLSLSSFGSVLALSGLGSTLLTTLASARRLFELTQEHPIVDFTVSPQQLSTFDEAQLTSVTFAYRKEHQAILSDLSLTLKKGTVIGIGGESGQGKSTLVKLLMRYWDPDQGIITMNQMSLCDIQEQALHEIEGVMEQETFIFEETIAANISMGKKTTMEEIKQAAKKAAIHEWILSLPKQYETKIGGTQRSISDGERQRIGMARLFLHDAPFILLDEPTSNLDYLNEQAVLHALRDSLQDKTVLVISHRETTLRIAQQQYALVQGRLLSKHYFS